MIMPGTGDPHAHAVSRHEACPWHLDACEDEGQRAGYLALGLLLIAAAAIGVRVPLMPVSVFLFGAALCFLQLSARALQFVESHRVTGAAVSLWCRIGGLPRGLRLALLVIVGLAVTSLLLAVPRSVPMRELTIDVLLSAGLILFVGPRRRMPG